MIRPARARSRSYTKIVYEVRGWLKRQFPEHDGYGWEARMKISMVGDVMLGRLVNEQLRSEDADFVWGDVLPILAQADLRFANLECVMADGGTPWPGKVFHFRSDAKNVACLE